MPGYEFINLNEKCVYQTLQEKTDLNYCVAYSLLYLILFMYNDNISHDKIMQGVGTLSKEESIILSNKFICYVHNIIEKKAMPSMVDI